MTAILPILIQVIVGALGGNGVAAILKDKNFSKILATITGIIGGVGGGQLAGLSGILETLTTIMGNNPDAGAATGTAVASGAGGAILTAIVAMIKKAMEQKAA